ncbi:leucine-rich repeat neuronal protein 2-like [Homarus americanus]|uniref:leucine-rich repeat neuronal protein 2-like n=1 Tax=Homarus americanus TaxID=6706 RepID=UPI001C45815F|nr:leucine-rich repeat neuronal protein 2-like [Homarus americanus]
MASMGRHQRDNNTREEPAKQSHHHQKHQDSQIVLTHHRDQQQQQGSHQQKRMCRRPPAAPCLVTAPASCPAAPITSCQLLRPRVSVSQMLLPPFAFYCLLLVGSLVTPCAAICPNNCTCDDEALVVRCKPSKIDVLPFTFNPALQQLTMYGTEIHSLDINSLRWYQDLRHVNLSKNMIMQVEPNTFENQLHLEELHLAQNNITNVTDTMFNGLYNLIVLSLRGNVIKSLDGGVFVHLKHLRDLDLSENQIEKLHDQALVGLSNLRILHLRDNRLTVIPAKNLALVSDLAELSLGGNNFTEIKEGDLQSMKTLKDLDLAGALLEGGLTEDSFKGLSVLRKLKLEDCGLKSVPTAPLSSLGKLEELHIGHNLFVNLPSDAFRSNRNLHSLFVSGCPNLVYLDKDVLRHNLNIKQVVIAQNPLLTYIAPNAFRFLPDLSLLDLHNNNLQQISEQAANWAEIASWHLEGNPITCNCSAAWLRMLTLAPNSSANLKCASPPHLAGIPLNFTQINDLACGMDATTRGVVIGLVVCFIVVVVAAVVVVMLYRHHGSCVHRLLKGHHIGGRGSRCDHHPYTHNYHPAYIMTPNKPVPVTEL